MIRSGHIASMMVLCTNYKQQTKWQSYLMAMSWYFTAAQHQHAQNLSRGKILLQILTSSIRVSSTNEDGHRWAGRWGVDLMMSYFTVNICHKILLTTADQSAELTHLSHQNSNWIRDNFQLIEQTHKHALLQSYLYDICNDILHRF